jgi:hypothetical protein
MISISFSAILNPVGKNGMKIKIVEVYRTIGKMYPFVIFIYLKYSGVLLSE